MEYNLVAEKIFSAKENKELYYLMRKDVPVLIFSMVKSGDTVTGLKVEDVFDNERLPVQMKNGMNLNKYIERRFIPKNRENAKVLRHLIRRVDGRYDVGKLIEYTKSVSLTDDFWTKEVNSQDTWGDINVFTNRFDETLSRIAFTGYGSDSEIALFSSPEFSTNGALRKAWRKRKDGIFLYKAGTDGFANSGNEPYSEFYACQILEAMCIPCIKYDLEMWEDRLCSVCKLFTSEEYSLVPASVLYERDYTNWLDRIKEGVGDEEVESVRDMIAFDALANNTDRHFNNFGVLQNNETFELEGHISVVYDNGLSLFYNEMERDFTSEYDRLLNETSLFTHDSSFVQISEFIGQRQKDKLRKLINFKFERHPKYNLPDWRLEALERLLQERLRIMLSM